MIDLTQSNGQWLHSMDNDGGDEEPGEDNGDDGSEGLSEKFIERLKEKGRVYVDDPSEAPEDVELHEGDEGGTYYFTGDAEEEQEEGDDSGSSDISRDPEDYRRVPLGDVEIDEGTILDFDGEVLEVESVEGGSATGIYGDNAGYAVLEDGTYATLNGDRPETFDEVLLEDVPDDQIRAFTGADALEESDPETSGSDSVDEWNVEWDNVIHSNYEPTEAELERDLIRLDEDSKRHFRNEWEEAAPEEGVSGVAQTLNGIKGTTMSTSGQKYDKILKETHGVAGDPRQGDFDDADEPTEEEVEAMRVFTEASQKFARENWGEEFDIHRGLGNHAIEGVMQKVSEHLTGGSVDTFELRDNPAAVFTADKKMAKSYDKGLIMHKDISAEDVLATPEALVDFSDGRGPDWNEGEVNVAGWDLESSMDEFTLGKTDVTLQEAVENPVETWYEADEGERAIETLARLVAREGTPEAAHELRNEIFNHRGYTDEMSDLLEPLNEASREVIAADDDTDVIDLRPDAEWLSEAARDQYAGEDLADKFVKRIMQKGRVYVDSPEDAPEDANVQTGEDGGTYYVTEGSGDEESDDSDDADDDLSAGDEITIDNFGQEQEVTVVDPNLPNGILVETEDGNQMSVGEHADMVTEDDVKEDVIENAVSKITSWLPLASESPDPQREEVDAPWNEVEDPENLADKFIKRLMGKNRVYLEDPSDAPQGALVRQGRSGVWFYDTRQTQENSPTRVYVSSPEEAPDGCTVRGGESGGYYYYDQEHPRGQR